MVVLAQEMVYRFGSFTLDLGRGALLAADAKEIPLRPKSFAVLRFLVENGGRLLSRDEIMEAVWSNIYVTDDNITQCIHDIRRGLNGECDELLRTVPRRGYIFAAGVVVERQPLHSHPQWRVHDLDAPGPSGASPSGGVALRETEAGNTRDNPGEQLFPPRRSRVGSPPRMSVLMTLLRDVGVPDKCKYLVEGISEDIATDLSRLPGMFVVGHAESSIRTGETSNARTVARDYGLNYIIQGSMRGSTDQIGVNVQLIDSETGAHLWAERFDIECVSAPDASNEMTGRLVRALSVKLVEDANRRIEALPPQEWSPYDLIVRGQAFINRPISAANRQQAVGCFERALLGDPDSTDAKAGIAYVLIADVADGWSRLPGSPSVNEDEARAERLLTEVLHVEEDRPMGHALMGCLRRLQGRLHDSQIELEIALALIPNSAGVLGQLGTTLTLMGQPEAALPHIKRSLRLAPHDPSTPMYRSNLGLCHLLLDNIEEAVICLKKARAGNPRFFYTHLWLAAALGLRGELDEAGTALRRAIDIKPELVRRSSLRGLARQPDPRFSALWQKTVDVGLQRAGMRDE